MSKLGLTASLLSIAVTLGLVARVAPTAEAGAACKRTTFETKLVREACTKGGQAEAKKVMKAFMKKAKAKQADLSCQTCHTKLAPAYELKADGLQRFKDLGGK